MKTYTFTKNVFSAKKKRLKTAVWLLFQNKQRKFCFYNYFLREVTLL